jgi:uncharacterized membrane protein
MAVDQTTKSIIVRAPVSAVFEHWADFEQFPRFMKHIRSVTRTGPDRSHWVAEGPLGKKVEWDAVTTRFEPPVRLAWRSADGSELKTSGQVVFAEIGPDETDVTVTLQYVPPAGLAGELVAELFGDPEERLAGDLRRFKAHVEGPESRAIRENEPDTRDDAGQAGARMVASDVEGGPLAPGSALDPAARDREPV